MKYKLAIIPEGWKVVPEEPTDEMIQYVRDDLYSAEWIYKDMLGKAPPLDKPPVLRWEEGRLMLGNEIIITIWQKIYDLRWVVDGNPESYTNQQEARRAAEKALGFPDGLVVEVV